MHSFLYFAPANHHHHQSQRKSHCLSMLRTLLVHMFVDLAALDFIRARFHFSSFASTTAPVPLNPRAAAPALGDRQKQDRANLHVQLPGQGGPHSVYRRQGRRRGNLMLNFLIFDFYSSCAIARHALGRHRLASTAASTTPRAPEGSVDRHRFVA